MPQHEHDPWDDALSTPVPPDYPFAGKLTMRVENYALIKGQRRAPWDPAIHQGVQPTPMIFITIEPLDPTAKFIEKSMTFRDKKYSEVFRADVLALIPRLAQIHNLPAPIIQDPRTGQWTANGQQFNPLRLINEQWVIGCKVQDPDNKPGDTWQTPHITAVFATFEECQAAYSATTEPAPVADSTPLPPVADPQKTAMAAFLPALWAQAGKDATKFADLLHSNPLLAGHFTMQSPEVIALTGVPF